MISESDGDRHFVSGHRLIELYGVDPRRCLILTEPAMQGFQMMPGDIELAPCYFREDYDRPLRRD